jgi:hypothetical protein
MGSAKPLLSPVMIGLRAAILAHPLLSDLRFQFPFFPHAERYPSAEPLPHTFSPDGMTTTPTLFTLPNEVLLDLAGKIDDPSDLNSLLRTNRLFYRLLDQHLYKRRVSGRILERVIKDNNIPALGRFISNGLDVEMTMRYPEDVMCTIPGPLRPLFRAIVCRRPEMVRMLLQAGASTSMFVMNKAAADTRIGTMLVNRGVEVTEDLGHRHRSDGYDGPLLQVTYYPLRAWIRLTI